MAQRLSGIAWAARPANHSLRSSRIEWRGDGRPIARAGSVGSHGGGDVTRDLRQASASFTCDEAYVTQFVDFRSPDGLYRKLRIVFVDGQPWPVHLAIGDHWLSHYFRTAWRTGPLGAGGSGVPRNLEAYLGRDSSSALEKVPAQVGLDFFGIDGAIGPDGRLWCSNAMPRCSSATPTARPCSTTNASRPNVSEPPWADAATPCRPPCPAPGNP